ncbi:MAG: hypothetical protein ACKO28_00835 [Cyanobium sp.]
MRNPLESYLPEDSHDPPFRPMGYDRFRWVQWLQMGLTTALLVMFFNQLSQLQDTNRRIARLYERMDALDQTRMMDDSPALSAQQAMILKRLQALESAFKDRELETLGSSSDDPAALRPPPRP